MQRQADTAAPVKQKEGPPAARQHEVPPLPPQNTKQGTREVPPPPPPMHRHRCPRRLAEQQRLSERWPSQEMEARRSNQPAASWSGGVGRSGATGRTSGAGNTTSGRSRRAAKGRETNAKDCSSLRHPQLRRPAPQLLQRPTQAMTRPVTWCWGQDLQADQPRPRAQRRRPARRRRPGGYSGGYSRSSKWVTKASCHQQ